MSHPQRRSNKRRGKKRSQPISKLKQPAGCQNPTLVQTAEESKVFSSLTKTKQNGLSNSTIAEDDVAAAVMIGNMTDTTSFLSDDDNRTDSSFDFIDNVSCSNSDVSYTSGSRNKQIATIGMVSDISENSSNKIMLTGVPKAWEAMPDLSEPSSELFKSRQHNNSNTMIEDVRASFEKCGIQDHSRNSYVPVSSNNDLQGHMPRMGCNGRSYIDVLTGPKTSSEQTQDVKEKNQLYEHELSSNKRIGVRKWNGPTPTDVEKTWPALTSSGFSKSRQQHNSNTEVVSDVLEESYGLTGGDSYIASSSNSDLQEDNMSFKRSWLEVFAGPRTLQTLDVKGKSPLHDPGSWVKVVKKGSHKQTLNYLSKDSAKKQHIPEDDYKKYRHHANQYWENHKSLVEQARNADASGKLDDAATLFDQARMWKEKAEQADEKASEDIFDSRNKKNILDLITIDLHGLHVKEGMKILKTNLAFGVDGRSLQRLRVITGYGSGGTGQSMLKPVVVDLLKTENFEWEEENKGSLLIKFDRKKRKLGFVNCSNSD